MSTPQAELFGFPNPILGVAGFAALVTVAVTIISGARLPSWYWIGLTAGTALGTVFVHWLIFQSLYRIGALCPYCMVVWAVMIVLTGALNPARFRGSDAEFNIGTAVGAVQSLPPGVYIAMNGRIWDPTAVRKNVAANRFEAVG